MLFLLYGSTWAQTAQTAGQKAVQVKQATVIDTDSLLQQLEKDSVITSTSVSEDSVVNTGPPRNHSANHFLGLLRKAQLKSNAY